MDVAEYQVGGEGVGALGGVVEDGEDEGVTGLAGFGGDLVEFGGDVVGEAEGHVDGHGVPLPGLGQAPGWPNISKSLFHKRCIHRLQSIACYSQIAFRADTFLVLCNACASQAVFALEVASFYLILTGSCQLICAI